jgi:amino acid permease
VIFVIIFLTLFSSYKIYKTFQEDLKVQEQNAIRMQINKLLQKINMSDDEEEKKNLQSKVNQLKEELGEINE